MKSSVIMKFLVIFAVLIISSCQGEKSRNTKQKTDINEFLGQWTIDIKDGSVGWIEIRQEDGYLDADVLWGGGEIIPVPYIFLVDSVLYIGRDTRRVIRKKDSEENNSRVWYKKRVEMTFPVCLKIQKEPGKANKIVGHVLSPKENGIGVDSTSFIGTRLPDVPPAPDLTGLKYGNPIVLFNGNDLRGWKSLDKKLKNPFHVVDGVLVKDPEPNVRYTELRTEQEFEDFNLKLEVNVPKRNNSGVYLRGIYEIAIEQGHADSGGRELDACNIGGVYSRISTTVNAERPAGTWQTLDITLCDRHINVILNGTTVIDNQPVYGPTGGAISSDVFAPGPIMIQGTEAGKVLFRNIVLKPIVK